MESLSSEALKILLLVFPGILTLEVRRMLSYSPRESVFETTIFALFYTLLDRLLFFPFVDSTWVRWVNSPLMNQQGLWKELFDQGGYALFLIAGLVGLVLGVLRDRDWDYGALRALRLTTRTARTDTWQEVLNKKKKVWLLVTLVDGKRYVGWPQTFSDTPGVHEMLLADASPVDASGMVNTKYESDILLLRDNPIVSVEILRSNGALVKHEQKGK